MSGIPSWLQHLHGTSHGWWYYGCDCYPCYAQQSRDCKNQVMTREEWDADNRLQEMVEEMTPEDREEFFRKEGQGGEYDGMEALEILQRMGGINNPPPLLK